MELLHHHETPDDGYFKLYKVNCDISYKQLLEDVNNYVYDCDGFSINSRNTGLFTIKREKIGQPLCKEWKYIPTRYIYQSFTPMLRRLLNIVQDLYQERTFTDAIVNVYNEGDFIAHHKDYHASNKQPCSVVFSFECDERNQHIMEFYRTIGDQWSTKKDKSENREEFTIPLPHQSIGIMVGMQRNYVHAIRPGKKRISVVFR